MAKINLKLFVDDVKSGMDANDALNKQGLEYENEQIRPIRKPKYCYDKPAGKPTISIVG